MTSSAGWAAAAHLVRSAGFGAAGDLVDTVAAAGPPSWLEASLRATPESDPGVASTSPAVVRGAGPAPPGRLAGGAPEAAPAGDRQGRPAGRVVDPPDGRGREPAGREADLRVAQPLRHVSDEGPVGGDAVGPERHPAHQGPRPVHRPRRGHGRRPRAAALAGRPAEHREGAQREPLPRVHGAVHAGPLGRVHRAGRPRGRPRAHRMDPRPAGGNRHLRAPAPRRRPKTVLGTTANLDATGFVDVLLDQPTSAPFIATRWWQLARRPDRPALRRARPDGHRVRTGPRPRGALPGDADRRRVCGERRFAGGRRRSSGSSARCAHST